MMTISLWIVAFFFLGMGLGGLLKPQLAEPVMKLGVDNAVARNEVRGVYGGFGVFIAALIIYSAQVPELREGILLAVAVSLAGMASGRLVSFMIEKPNLLTISFFLSEAALTGLLVINII